MRSSQESVLKALQQYTLSHYPDVPSKFGELLLRIPELERTCQVIHFILNRLKEREISNSNIFCSPGRKGHAHREKGRGWSGIQSSNGALARGPLAILALEM